MLTMEIFVFKKQCHAKPLSKTTTKQQQQPNSLMFFATGFHCFLKKPVPESNHFQKHCVDLQTRRNVKYETVVCYSGGVENENNGLIWNLYSHQFLLSLLLQPQKINLQTMTNKKNHELVIPSKKKNMETNIAIALLRASTKFNQTEEKCVKKQINKAHLVNIPSRQLPYPRATARAFFFHYEHLMP